MKTALGKVVFAAGSAETLDLWKLDLATKQLTQLTTGQFWNDSPKWSPDGKQIAFVSNQSGIPQIYLDNEDGSARRQLTQQPTFHGDPAWAPDGSFVSFCSTFGNKGEMGVFAIPVTGGKEEKLFSGAGMITHPTWNRDGNRVLFSCTKSGHYNIWEYDMPTETFTQLTDGVGEDSAPAYSPDGAMIAFVSKRDPQKTGSQRDTGIWVMNSDGSKQRLITRGEDHDKHLTWSPDGVTLMYCASFADSERERLKTVDLIREQAVTMVFDRGPILERLGMANAKQPGFLGKLGLVPEKLEKMLYGGALLGSERRPDWY